MNGLLCRTFAVWGVALSLIASVAWSQPVAETSDLEQADAAALRVMVQELRAAVQELRQQNAQLQMQLRELKEQSASAAAPIPDTTARESSASGWVVKVLANPKPDSQDLEKKLQVVREQYASGYRLRNYAQAGIESLIQEQQEELMRMASAREYYYVSGEGERTRSKYSAEELSLKRSQIAKLKQQRDQMVRTMRELEEQIQETKLVRRINVVTRQGQAMVIVARGNYLGLGESMEVGRSYRVQGPPIGGGSAMQIHLRLAEPAAIDVSESPTTMPSSLPSDTEG